MSKAGLLLLASVCAAFAAGCGEEASGNGGSGTGGSAGGAGSGGTGGPAALPRPCASKWEEPPGMPIRSHECTYDLDADPPTRDCTFQSGTRILSAYDPDPTRCGMPCVAGRAFQHGAGNHFDFTFLSLAETTTFMNGILFSRLVHELDSAGNETTLTFYDADGMPVQTNTTTYDKPQQPTSFETRIDPGDMFASSGTMMWDNGKLEAYEVQTRLEYSYNPNGSPGVVTMIDPEDSTERGRFTFSYEPDVATVTLVMGEQTRSVLTIDFACE